MPRGVDDPTTRALARSVDSPDDIEAHLRAMADRPRYPAAA